jgi:hypothetical protein
MELLNKVSTDKISKTSEFTSTLTSSKSALISTSYEICNDFNEKKKNIQSVESTLKNSNPLKYQQTPLSSTIENSKFHSLTNKKTPVHIKFHDTDSDNESILFPEQSQSISINNKDGNKRKYEVLASIYDSRYLYPKISII